MAKKEWKSGGKVKQDNKKIGIPLLLCAMCLGLAGCAFFQWNGKIEIHPAVSKFLEEQQINKSAILSLGDYSDISYHLEVPEVTEEEMGAYEDELTDIFGIKEVTLDFIQENFGLSSYDAYREFLGTSVFNDKKYGDQRKCMQNILGRLVDGAAFDLDQEEVAQFSLEKIVPEYENTAYDEGMTLEEYCEQEMQMTQEDFFDMCYKEGEQEIKGYFVIGALAGRKYGDVTEEMLIEGMDDDYTESDMEWCYRELEHDVYKLFIHAEEGYWLSEYKKQ